jgi:c-di-AMP phosphodiesterase-like protein
MARSAMDLALGRGGDQAVLKAGSKVTYFGGKSQMNEKNDRVKVRVKAQALRRVMENNDSFIIMGHRIADIDCIGSGIGIYTMARKMKKDVHIVLNEVTSTVEPFVKRFMKNEDYPDDMFYTSQEALDNVTPATVLIVVDVNKPEMTECPELLSICRTKIVFDHHRQTSEPITDTFMSYVDSSASSASEMVTEMLTYINEGSKLRGVEADALYAGIVIDTDGFNSKSGPRTFEVAAYLRRNGADVSRVRKLLRSDMKEYQAIAAAVNRAEVYRDSFAITVFMGEGLKSPTIGGAKTANDLLDIRGIKASFVVTEYEGRIFASARSIDEVNVQLVMEKIGGGGHMTVAGAQLTNMTVNEVVNLIKTTLDEMLENEEI